MKKVVHIFHSFREAELSEIEQQISMTPAQRQRIARAIKRRIYGPHPPDVRSFRPKT